MKWFSGCIRIEQASITDASVSASGNVGPQTCLKWPFLWCFQSTGAMDSTERTRLLCLFVQVDTTLCVFDRLAMCTCTDRSVVHSLFSGFLGLCVMLTVQNGSLVCNVLYATTIIYCERREQYHYHVAINHGTANTTRSRAWFDSSKPTGSPAYC